jgi:hypothetical protein
MLKNSFAHFYFYVYNAFLIVDLMTVQLVISFISNRVHTKYEGSNIVG